MNNKVFLAKSVVYYENYFGLNDSCNSIIGAFSTRDECVKAIMSVHSQRVALDEEAFGVKFELDNDLSCLNLATYKYENKGFEVYYSINELVMGEINEDFVNM